MALKVFGGLLFKQGKQIRHIVSASSQKKAAELLGVSVGEVRSLWAQTGNKIELEVALAQPGTVFLKVSDSNYEPAPASAQ